MKRVLVLGDGIEDVYRHFTASRLCPEAPLPVLVKTQEEYSTPGGAGLVAGQLRELFGSEQAVVFIPGSHSIKERIFADGHLVARMDDDGVVLAPDDYLKNYSLISFDAVVVSDYDKGSFTRLAARELVYRTNKASIPLFVDAKKNWEWYDGAFAVFPNEKEMPDCELYRFMFKHKVQKLGANGCKVNGVHIPTKNHAVRDVTGAGDVFLAAFAYHWLESPFKPLFNIPKNIFWEGTTVPRSELLPESIRLFNAARFANKVAGTSVEYVGTHVVTKKELDERPD